MALFADPASPMIAVETVARRILLIRGTKAMLDADLAELYGVPTKALNQAVRRNIERFPADFMFPLTKAEKQEVVTNCDHLARLKFSPTLPYAFTEHGALMLGNVLKSNRAVEISLLVVRTFVQLRKLLSAHKDLAAKLETLEKKIGSHDQAIAGLIDAIRLLMVPPHQSKHRPTGFVVPDEMPKKAKKTDPHLALLEQLLSGAPELEFAVLVGSRARGTARTKSDWDIALQWHPQADWLALLGTQETLRRSIADILGASPEDIDLIDLPRANLAMRANAAEDGVVLKGEDTLAWARFLTRTWRELEDFYWERAHAA